MKKLLFVLALLFALPAGAQTCTINVASPYGPTQVLAALNSISSDGAVVCIPASDVVWASVISYTQTKSFTLEGAGAISGQGVVGGSVVNINGSGTDNTIIEDGYNHTASDVPLISIATISGKSLRITGIAFKWAAGNASVTYHGVIDIYGNSTSVRFDHNHVNRLQAKDLVFTGCPQGVIDHNQFDSGYGDDAQIEFEQGGCNGDASGLGNGSWAAASGFGTSAFMFAENNNFQWTAASPGAGNLGAVAEDCDEGGNFVMRYNAYGFHTALEIHGTNGNDDYRGCRAFEVYGNNFAWSSSPSTDSFSFLVQYESGASLWWGNTVSGFVSFIYSDTVRNRNKGAQGGTYVNVPTPNGWGGCGSSTTGGGPSNWDENTDGTGYRCIDQVAAGQGDLLSGTFPTKCDQTLGCSTYNGQWPNQALDPVYAWDNTLTLTAWGGSAYFGSQAGPSGNVTVENRDYYLELPNHFEGASFNGTAGMGFGLLSARPSTCTPRVGYFATDANGGVGELYECLTTNTWTASYEPYTYPHPLVGGQALAPSGSPTNGVVTQTVTVTNPNSGTTDVCYAASPTVPVTDGTGTGCTTGTKYTAPISVTVAETLNLIAGTSTLADSAVVSYTYTASSSAPTVTAAPATGITASTASVLGTVTSNGGASVTSEGTCYALTANPTTPCTSDGTSTPFTSSLSGLIAGTIYHYRAFATNSVGTGYSSDHTFTTLTSCTSPTVVGAYTFCGEGYNQIASGSAVSVSYSPFPGNGIEIIGTWCANSSCNAASSATATLGDNINSTESCFTASPNSPYDFANTAVPDYGRIYAWYCPSIPSGVTTFTMTVSGTVSYPQFAVVEWLAGPIAAGSYFEIVDALGASGGTAGTTASVSTSATTVHASDLVTAWIANCGASIAATVGTGYTGIVVNPFGTPGTIVEAKGVVSTGTQTATTTWSSGTAGSNCQLSAGGSNDTWWGVIVPLIGIAGPAPSPNMFVWNGNVTKTTPYAQTITLSGTLTPGGYKITDKIPMTGSVSVTTSITCTCDLLKQTCGCIAK